VDLMVRQGVLDSPPKTPLTLGFECAGEVETLGEDTDGLAVSTCTVFYGILNIDRDVTTLMSARP